MGNILVSIINNCKMLLVAGSRHIFSLSIPFTPYLMSSVIFDLWIFVIFPLFPFSPQGRHNR